MKPLTADTITDEQIRELRASAMRESPRPKRTVEECNLALNLPPGFDRDLWRARCAELINARTEGRR